MAECGDSDVELPDDIDNHADDEQSQDDVQLPSDVESNDEHPVPPLGVRRSEASGSQSLQQTTECLVDESEVELPSDVASDSTNNDKEASAHGKYCTCSRRCHTRVDEDLVLTMRLQEQQKNRTDRQNGLMSAVRQLKSDGCKKIVWKIEDVVVCRPFWIYAHATSSDNLAKLSKLIEAGHADVPDLLPAVRDSSHGHQLSKADAWFLDLYEWVAEPLARNKSDEITSIHDEHHLIVDDPDHPLWTRSAMLYTDGEQKTVVCRKKHLNQGCFQDLVRLYQDQHAGDTTAVSPKTLERCFDAVDDMSGSMLPGNADGTDAYDDDGVDDDQWC